ncbi:uncharacterized protein LOC124406370 [Diprion similis]|uniref:uncharacterized protein LOC124406370 n=1 Tax=Diprion similis TaxID=362088 RepID=UPI001EF93F24|nr:uncharacterized protein LOC124406370 [Diprion similis]
MDDSSAVVFDVLTKNNYKSWRIKAEALLKVFNLWYYVIENKEPPKDVKLWMKKDKQAKSKLILHISKSLLPLVDNCETTREVWSKLENFYGNQDEEFEASIYSFKSNDKDSIINAIVECVKDFFNDINDSSKRKISEDKKSLSTTFTNNLFSRLKNINPKNFLDEKMIANAVSDFINGIDRLSKTEIKKRTNELSCKLIDNLRELIDLCNALLFKHHSDYKKVPHGLRNQYGYKNPLHPLTHLHTPPSTVTSETKRKCTICRKEGHNRRTCSLNRPIVPQPDFERATRAFKRSHNSEACDDRGCSRTTCPPNVSVTSASKSPDRAIKIPKRSQKCGACGVEGHNVRTCQANKSTISVSIPVVKTPTTPKTNKCRECGRKGHNIRTCPRMGSVPSLPRPATTGTRTGSYRCGLCGGEGHKSSSCSRNFVTPIPSARASPRCSTCGNTGHNSRTCGRHSTSSVSVHKPGYSKVLYSPSCSAPSYSGGGHRGYTCGICGGSGHNRRTCSD